MKTKISRPLKEIYQSRITWKIYNFFSGPFDINSAIESPIFITNLDVPIKWTLSVSEKQTRYQAVIKLQRVTASSGTPFVPIYVQFQWIDTYGDSYGVLGCGWEFNETPSMSLFSKVLYDHITSYSKRNLTNSIPVTIKCSLILDTTSPPSQRLDMVIDLISLSTNLFKFYITGKLADLDLMVDGKSYSVHKAIVKSRSVYIARILDENPDVKQIDLTRKCSVAEINGLIDYWYSGDFEIFPRMLPSKFLTFIRNMEQRELKLCVDPEDILITTTFKKVPRSFRWEIRDSDFCDKLRQIKSNAFSQYTLEEGICKLHIYPKGHTGNENKISLCVEVGEVFPLHPVYLEIFFLDGFDTEIGCQKTVSCMHSPGKYEFNDFMTHDVFMRRRRSLLFYNVLRIGSRFEYGTGMVENKIEQVSEDKRLDFTVPHTYAALANDLKVLFESGDMSDITLTTSDKKFKVHKAILAARSRYFELLLTNTELDAYKTDAIALDDVKSVDLDMILKYMYYAEKPELNLELALKLYPIVRKCKIEELERSCSEFLKSQLTVDNVISFIALADKYEDISLKTASLNVIKDNWNHISTNKKWQAFQNENSKLALKVMSVIQN